MAVGGISMGGFGALDLARARVAFHVWPGGHDSDYWEAHRQDTMRFYARALQECPG